MRSATRCPAPSAAAAIAAALTPLRAPSAQPAIVVAAMALTPFVYGMPVALISAELATVWRATPPPTALRAWQKCAFSMFVFSSCRGTAVRNGDG